MRILTIVLTALTLTGLLELLPTEYHSGKMKKPRLLHAGQALAEWYEQRSFPGTSIDMTYLSEGFQSMKRNQSRSAIFPGTWEAIGPKNFGGRTLALCFNPANPATMYAGSAAGGLWRTWSEGVGAQAWHQVETGFPLLGVAAIAINPFDTTEMFIGTGEVYNYQSTGTGFAIRTTRGTYGIGILKSSDGGATWSKSLDWQYDELRGIQDIIFNPVNPSTLFAATTEGTYRTYNRGQTWTLVDSTKMATDLLMLPGDTSVVFVAAGNSFSADPGIYRSINGGSNFTQITSGLPSTWSGKGMLAVCESSPQILYARIGEQISGLGLFRSDDAGLNWYQINSTDYQMHQGWYSHDVIVHPGDPDYILTSGIDVWQSFDGGLNLGQCTYWYNWDFSATTVGGPEGPPDYVHADVHRMYFHPTNYDIIYAATDGGVFRSTDGGFSFEGCNGSYQTQQFYANFSCSVTDSLFAIGGLQDNATAVYEGNPGWRRVIGGDGLSTSIDPNDDNIVYGSSQYLNIEQSTDHAQNFQNSIYVPTNGPQPRTNFAGPFIQCLSNPDIMYAGRDIVYKSIDGGQNWIGSNTPLDGNAVLVLEASDTDPNLVYAATAPAWIPQVGLFRTTNGGSTWINVISGIPNRYIMDVAINPDNNNMVFVGVAGYGTPHLFRSVNGGNSWSAFGNGLPDLPVNTITIDPLNDLIMYLGNDIGIYVSIDGGQTWQPFSDGLIDGTFVMDISISSSNRKLRLATHGKGVYERDMLPVTITGITAPVSATSISITPNPATDVITISITGIGTNSTVKIFDVTGKVIRVMRPTTTVYQMEISNLESGRYFIVAENEQQQIATSFIKL